MKCANCGTECNGMNRWGCGGNFCKVCGCSWQQSWLISKGLDPNKVTVEQLERMYAEKWVTK